MPIRAYITKNMELIERLAGVTEELEDIVAVSQGKRRASPPISFRKLMTTTEKVLGKQIPIRLFNIFRLVLIKNLVKGHSTVSTYLAGKDLAKNIEVKSAEKMIKVVEDFKFGKLVVKELTPERTNLILQRSATSLGAGSIGSQPVCFLEAGFLAALCEKILVKKSDLVETKCVARGDKSCQFVAFTEEEALHRKIGLPVLPAELYNQENVRLLTTLASHAITAIENALLFDRARRQVMMDALTQVYNHRYFQQTLRTELARAERNRLSLSLIMIDIDNFKKYNDTHGHPKGDEVLKKVASIIADCVRDVDVVARYGGDEFALILPQTNTGGAAVVAERISKAVSKATFYGRTKRHHIQFGVTQGIATYLKGYPDPEGLIKRADKAMLRAKKSKVKIIIATK